MPNEAKGPLAGVNFETKGVPVIYTNHASPSISFNDVRIYFGEIFPKELAVESSNSQQPIRIDATMEPRLCVVMTPEFARSLVDALQKAVEKYESVFGSMRSQPTMESVDQKLLAK